MLLLKGSFRASFLIIIICFFLAHSIHASEDHLPQKNTKIWKSWLALLHLKDNRLSINNNEFLFSASNFSAEAEWKLSYKMLKDNKSLQCRFPARLLLLSWWYSDISLNFDHCEGYLNFLKHVPVEDVSVIYASENLTNPTSIMGHTMLAVEGEREDGFRAKHSVSFLTDLDSFNPVSIIWDTLVKGKDGYFLVKPLSNHYAFYNVKEQRNVWKYELSLSEEDKQLIQAHIWELKHTNIDYFFHTQNCATLTLDILRVSGKDIPNKGWTSPVDVAKSVDFAGLVKHVEIRPSPKWKIHLLEDALSLSEINEVETWLASGELKFSENPESDFLKYEYYTAILKYKTDTGKATQKERKKFKEYNELNKFDGFSLNIDSTRSPLSTQGDANFTAAYFNRGGEDLLKLTWLPAGRGIEDNNFNYFGENELKLGEITLLTDLERGDFKLDRLQLYSTTSLSPHGEKVNSLSALFRFGYYPQYYDLPKVDHQAELAGGVGEVYNVDTVNFYWRLGGGFAFLEEANLFVEPEVGTYFYQTHFSKTWLRYNYKRNSSGDATNILRLTQTFSRKETAWLIDLAGYLDKENNDLFEFSLSWRRYF